MNLKNKREIKMKNKVFDMRYETFFLGQLRPLCSNYAIELWVCWFMFNWRSLYYMANKFYTRHKDLFLPLIRYLICTTSRDSCRDGWIEKILKRKWRSGLFWAGGAAEKKNCHKYATFWGGFFNFLWAKKDLKFF